ncbi:hypothetical protein [uncultured Desulfobacter sp.]|uniref:hypothetical protein n=1 Tax=uncultured Desulfobacter sp. TaxID=240139 RepID=UPI0029F47529|nr:hypothetical protein [uncultured Desulfobacter sp.]
MDDSAPTQHIFHASVSTKKPETAVISGLQLVEATGVEPDAKPFFTIKSMP